MTAAAMAGGDATVNVTAASLVHRLGEAAHGALFGETFALVQRGETAGGRERAE
jgi:hypothetical protein